MSELPLVHEDLEAEDRSAAARILPEAITKSDALRFASTEYNYGMSGVLKNAVDSASRPSPVSRPSEEEAPEAGTIYAVPASPLSREPAAMLGASAGLGGTIRPQLGLRQALQFDSCLALPQPELFVTFAFSGKFDTATGDLIAPQTQAYVRNLVDTAVAWVPLARLPVAVDGACAGS